MKVRFTEEQIIKALTHNQKGETAIREQLEDEIDLTDYPERKNERC